MNAPRNPAIHPKLTDALRIAVTRKAADARALLAQALAEFGDRLAFANSLGAEDVAITHLACSAHLPLETFLLDTGRLPAETYSLLARLEARYKTRFKLYFPDAGAVEAFVAAHGIDAFFESVELRRACCRVRKLEPLKRALTGKQAWITGLRAAQSPTRDGLATREWDEANGLVKFNPLADWSEAEVWAYIRMNDVPYNTLHERFYPSIGCAPCTRAISLGEELRAGRWWWEAPQSKECGLHAKT